MHLKLFNIKLSLQLNMKYNRNIKSDFNLVIYTQHIIEVSNILHVMYTREFFTTYNRLSTMERLFFCLFCFVYFLIRHWVLFELAQGNRRANTESSIQRLTELCFEPVN